MNNFIQCFTKKHTKSEYLGKAILLAKDALEPK